MSRSHGHTAGGRLSPTYQSWDAMRKRCSLRTHVGFKNYGGRGIAVCAHWRDFANFLADMGERPPGTSLDRVDSNGNYEAANCRWATPVEQHSNRRDSHLLRAFGRTRTLAEWSRQTGLAASTIFGRIGRGMDVETALRLPPRTHAGRTKQAEARPLFALEGGE